MRKKTIEEELKEIADEKDDLIEQLEKQLGHSKAHRYDFSPNEKSSKTSERTYTVYGKKVTKEEYDQWQKDFGKREEKLNEAKNELAKMKSERNYVINGTSSDDKFTIDDYKKMIELEERELSDEEFDEYYNLCDRFGDLSDEKRDKIEKLYDVVYSQKSTARVDTTNTSTQSTNTYSHPLNTNNTPRKRNITLGSALFPIIFLCFFVAAGLGVTIFAGIIPMTKYADYVKLTATVQEVEHTYYDDDGDLHASMIVSFMFKANGDEIEQPYQAHIKTQVSRMPEEGVSNITIYVNPADPTQVSDGGSDNFIFPLIFGIVFAGFALFMQSVLITQVVKTKKRNKKI